MPGNEIKEGCTPWKPLRKLQEVHSGRQPVTTSAVYKQEGVLTSNPDGLRDCWSHHFSQVFTVATCSNFDVTC